MRIPACRSELGHELLGLYLLEDTMVVSPNQNICGVGLIIGSVVWFSAKS